MSSTASPAPSTAWRPSVNTAGSRSSAKASRPTDTGSAAPTAPAPTAGRASSTGSEVSTESDPRRRGDRVTDRTTPPPTPSHRHPRHRPRRSRRRQRRPTSRSRRPLTLPSTTAVKHPRGPAGAPFRWGLSLLARLLVSGGHDLVTGCLNGRQRIVINSQRRRQRLDPLAQVGRREFTPMRMRDGPSRD
jgi:hypothetical protein